MSEPNETLPPEPKVVAQSNHNLSWIAMVAMALMCALTLVWAASLTTG